MQEKSIILRCLEYLGKEDRHLRVVCFMLHSVIQMRGAQIFQKTLEPPQSSRQQNGKMEQVR
jgi:hypothetical protein